MIDSFLKSSFKSPRTGLTTVLCCFIVFSLCLQTLFICQSSTIIYEGSQSVSSYDDEYEDFVHTSSEAEPVTYRQVSASDVESPLYRHMREKDHKDDSKMTVVITTYKQQICLERMIILLRSCPVVAEIRVNWFLPDEEPQLYNEFTSNHLIPVYFDTYPDRLSYRFHPRNFTTNAVFSVDVDTFYSCESLEMALETWRQNPHSAVGFHGRYIRPSGYDWDHSYEGLFEYNTLFITKGGIIHRKLFDEYFQDEYKHLRDAVDAAITAEDILMSFIMDAKNVKVIQTCPEEHSICHVDCKQNNVGSLNKRTAQARGGLIEMFYEHFGLTKALRRVHRGASQTVWQGQKQEICRTRNTDEYENTPHCQKFCARNIICPSHVEG